MDDNPKPRRGPPREVKEKAVKAIGSVKKRSASTLGRSRRAQKARKLNPYRTPSPHVDEGAEDVSVPSHRTPSPHVDEGAEDVGASSPRTPSPNVDEGAEYVSAHSTGHPPR